MTESTSPTQPTSSAPSVYVPPPSAASSDYLIGAHYYPGWIKSSSYGWHKVKPFPERKPLLGYYAEENPEVTDWEIKWALEHGIQFFLYCWYREPKLIDQPMSDKTQFYGHAIHQGLFHARYGEQMKFAIMWEAANAAGALDEKDLLDNLLPYWMDTYFSRPNYLKIDGKPFLGIYSQSSMDKIAEPFGGMAGLHDALQRMREKAAKRFGGLVLAFEYRGPSRAALEQIRSTGVDQVFAYCWHPKQKSPTHQQAIDRQMEALTSWRDQAVMPFLATASVGWDPTPWTNDDPKLPWLNADKMIRWKLPPEQWRKLLDQVKGFMDGLPETSPARRILLLDNWNEWGEGHYISPQVTDGFKYLQAVREVFTSRDNLPDYRLPETLGLGPYEAS